MLRNRKASLALQMCLGLGAISLGVVSNVALSVSALDVGWTEPFVMAALGDSITMAMNADGWGDAPELAWSTGTDGDVMSHYQRLELQQGNQVRVESLNAARSGAESDELEDQVNQVLFKRPNYVTILMGANDLCHWSKDDPEQINSFQSNVENAVQRLIKARGDVKILISPIPDMYRLWEVGKAHGCQFRWNFARICKPLLHSSRTEAERQAFRVRQEQANQALGSIADKYPDNVKYAGKLMHYPFEWDHISDIDCFHPSKAGQTLLSELTWRLGWFAE